MAVSENLTLVKEFLDHDTLIIMALVAIGFYAMYVFETQALTIVNSIVSGFLGMAYGKTKGGTEK